MATEKRLIDAGELLRDARCNKPIAACLADIVDIQDLINDQPTVDAVEVVHGRWIADTPFCCSCSICNHTRGGLAHEDGQNYCPNCGAKMDGERRTDNV